MAVQKIKSLSWIYENFRIRKSNKKTLLVFDKGEHLINSCKSNLNLREAKFLDNKVICTIALQKLI